LPAFGAQGIELMGDGEFFAEKRLAGVEPYFAGCDGLLRGHGWYPSDWVVGFGSCFDLANASFSQGVTWKRLISRYIQVMPSIGNPPGAEEQITACGA
jgi:hypothetical protein